jgi:hypothetical protein
MCGADLSDLEEEKSDLDEGKPKKEKNGSCGCPSKDGGQKI